MAYSSLKFTNQTDMAAKVLFVVFFFYSIVYLPVVQAIVSIAVAGIAYGYTEKYEVALVAALLANFFYPILTVPFRRGGAEGFTGTTSDGADVISKRISSLQGGKPAVRPCEGVKAEKFRGSSIEGFEGGANEEEVAGYIDGSGAKVDASGNEAFESEAIEQPGLFKLGQIPKDSKSGYHIDTGTTVMNALNALKPDQLKAMTTDTKQLIETQKSLMSMLQTIKPMMHEGRQMMDTFNDMFGQEGAPKS